MRHHATLRRSNRPTIAWTLNRALTGIGSVALMVCAGAAFGTPGGAASGGGDESSGGGGPIVDSISPNQVIEEPVPQPEIVITGSNLVVGLPSPKNRPTVTITHTELDDVSYSTQANVNFSGTQATIPGNLNHFNMLQMPLGEYDVLLSRPDGQSVAIPGGFSLTTQPEPVPGEIRMDVLSWWGGPIHGMDVEGDYAYLANGRRLVILDISDPTVPTEVGSIYLRATQDVKVKDGFAFVAADDGYSFSVVDVSNPAEPDLVWVTGSMGGGIGAAQIELYGNFAYIRHRSSGVHIFDISDPLNVIAHGAIADASGATSPRSMMIHEDHLYAGNQAGFTGVPLRIFDLAANPIAPPMIASPEWSNINEVTSIAASGDQVYVTARYHDLEKNGETDYLCAIDIADPANPTILNEELQEFLLLAQLAVADDRLYLVERMERAYNLSDVQGLTIYDIGADPAVPALIDSHQTRGGVGSVLPIGEMLYLWDLAEGFVIMNAADPLDLQRIGNYHSPADLRQMAKSGDYLYVADGWGGLTILNVADGMAPVVENVYLPSTEPDGYVDAYGVAERNGLVYLTLRRRLEVIDVNDPSNPALAGAYSLDDIPEPFDENWMRGISLYGSSAYLGYSRQLGMGLSSRLLELNISNPANITLSSLTPVDYSGNTYPKDAIHAIEPVVGNPLSLPHYHYLAGNPNRIIVEDDGGTAVQIDTAQISAEDLIVKNGLAFTAMASVESASEYSGLRIEDVSDPANPVTLSVTNSAFGSTSGARAYTVDIQNGRAYVTSNVSGGSLHVVDIADPFQPSVLDVVSVRGLQGHVLTDEPHVYLTHESYGGPGVGFAIVHVHGAEPAVPGDLNGDGAVNVLDLLLLLGAWGECAAPGRGDCPADLNEDGTVNVLDMLMLLGKWG